MVDTATRETGPVDAPASIDSVTAEFEAGGEAPADAVEGIVEELVNEAESDGGEPSNEEPAAEDDATDPADAAIEAATETEGVPEGNPDEQMVTVKVAGEERQVPLSEALAGYSRLEDYKAKTAEVAQEKRQLEQQRSNLDAELKARYASQLEQATTLFSQFDPVLAEARTINWEALKAQDPAAYVQAQDAVQARLTAIHAMKQQVETLSGETQAHQQQQVEQERAARFDQTAEKIVQAMPELADEAKFQTFAGEAIGFLRGEGFSNEEIADSLDHRVLTLANDARQWRAHKSAQAALPEKRVVTKSAVKPLTTDGTSSRATPPRFPSQASRERKVDWVTSQLLSEE
jgi:hypothetical protein